MYDVALCTHKSTMTMWKGSTRSYPVIKAISQWMLSRCACSSAAILCGTSVSEVEWIEFLLLNVQTLRLPCYVHASVSVYY